MIAEKKYKDFVFSYEYSTGSIFHFGTSNNTYIGLNGPFYGSGSGAAVSYIRNGTEEEIVWLGHDVCSGWCPVFDMVYHKASTTTTTISKSGLSVKGTHTLFLDQRFNPSTITAAITFSY